MATGRNLTASAGRSFVKRSGLLTLVIMSVVIVGSPLAQAQQTPRSSLPLTNLQYGFTMALLGNNPVVRSMGFQWVSYTVRWDTAEPSPGVYDWGDANNIANGARTAGLNVLIRVSRSPQWARDPSCSTFVTCPPDDPRTLRGFHGRAGRACPATHISATSGL